MVEVQEEDAHPAAAVGRAREREGQLREELAAIRQPRQRVVRRQVLQLPRALLDLGLELAVILAGQRLRGRKLPRHVVERHRQRVEFADAAARHGDARFALREAPGGVQQAAHGRIDAEHRVHGDDQQQQQHAAGQPGEQRALPVVLRGDGGERLAGLAPRPGDRARRLELRRGGARLRRQRRVARRECLDGGVALPASLRQRIGERRQAAHESARRGEPVLAERAHDVAFIVREDRGQGALAGGDGAQPAPVVARGSAETGSLGAHPFEGPVGIGEVLARRDRAEQLAGLLEGFLEPRLQGFQLKSDLARQAAPGIRGLQQRGGQLPMRRDPCGEIRSRIMGPGRRAQDGGMGRVRSRQRGNRVIVRPHARRFVGIHAREHRELEAVERFRQQVGAGLLLGRGLGGGAGLERADHGAAVLDDRVRGDREGRDRAECDRQARHDAEA